MMNEELRAVTATSPKAREKSLIFLSAIILFLFVIILAYIYTSQVEVFWRHTIEHITVSTEKYESIIYSWFAPKLKLVDIICADLVYFGLTENEEIGRYFTNAVEAEPNIMAIFIATEDKNLVFDSGREAPEGFDPTVRVWYVAAKENSGAATVSEPYIDILTGDLVITICKTIQLANGLDGVVGIDVGLTDIIELIGNIRPSYSGTSFLLSGNGSIVTHANADYLPKEASGVTVFHNYQDIPAKSVRQIDNNNAQVYLERLVAEGTDKYVSRIAITDINWFYGNEIPVSDFYDDLRNIAIPLIMALMLGLAIFSFGVVFYVNLISKLRKANQAEKHHNEEMLTALNKMAVMLISHEDDSFENTMSISIKQIAGVAGINRVAVYRRVGTETQVGQVYLWYKGKTMPLEEEMRIVPEVPPVLRWFDILRTSSYINANVSDMPEDEADFLTRLGVKSIFFEPIYVRRELWGVITLEDHDRYRYFEEDILDLLRAAAQMCAGAVVRHEIERESKELEKQAERVYYDALTGIYNRRYLDENLPHLISTLSRSGSKLSLMMLDIDCFKQYNDTYGHNRGDVCLKTVAKVISASLQRSEDFVVRYGGEEFTVVLPNTDENGARMIAEKILKNMQTRSIPHKSSDIAKHVTVSIGVTTCVADFAQNSGDFIKHADELLYISKKNGRNRYTFRAYNG